MTTDLTDFLIGAAVNLASALLIVRGIYFPVTRAKNYVFSFLVFNTMIFAVLSLLGSVELSVGLGFGLFAIFSVLNYRTDEMPIREMTYLFTLIALPVMNAFMLSGANLPQVLAANGLVIGTMFVLEKGWGFRYEGSHKLTYDNLELITPENRERLLEDLRTRTGLAVNRAEVARIDFVRDTAEITIHFDAARTAPTAQATPTRTAAAARPFLAS
jgi:hypothetical protein